MRFKQSAVKLILSVFLLIFALILSSCAALKSGDYSVDPEINKLITLNTSYPQAYDYTLDYLIGASDKIVYAEVISRESSAAEVFDYYALNIIPKTYAYTKVKIKILNFLKGECESEIIYLEAGGKMGDTYYFSNGESTLQVGDRAVLFLSDKNMLIGTEKRGKFKETADSCFYIDKRILEEGSYKENKLLNAKISKKEFFEYLNRKIAENNGESSISKITKSKLRSNPVNDDSLYYNVKAAYYGEVISIGESKSYDFGVQIHNSEDYVFTYINTEVKIKVISTIKGEKEDYVNFIMPGGEKDGYKFILEDYGNLKTGDKLIVCLSENNSFFGDEGLLIADKSGKVIYGGESIDIIECADILTGKFKETEEELKEKDADRLKYGLKLGSATFNNPEILDPEIEAKTSIIESVMNDIDLIVRGTVTLGREDIEYYQTLNYKEGVGTLIHPDMLYTVVNLKDPECCYNRYGSKDLGEISYLRQGGESETYAVESSKTTVKEGDEVLAFLRYNGAEFVEEYQFFIDENGILDIPEIFIPLEDKENFRNNKTAENYMAILEKLILKTE